MVTTSCTAVRCRYQQAVQKDFKIVMVLAVLAVVLVVGVLAAAAINPYALIGLPAVLLAVAAIVRAVGGRHDEDDRGQKPRKTHAKVNRSSITAGRRRR